MLWFGNPQCIGCFSGVCIEPLQPSTGANYCPCQLYPVGLYMRGSVRWGRWQAYKKQWRAWLFFFFFLVVDLRPALGKLCLPQEGTASFAKSHFHLILAAKVWWTAVENNAFILFINKGFGILADIRKWLVALTILRMAVTKIMLKFLREREAKWEA